MNAHHDILVVGHYSHDILISASGEVTHRLGGPPAYISAILEPLGADYSVVSKVGPDFIYFSDAYKKPIVVQNGRTTSCMNDYSQAERRQVVPEVCEAIRPGDVTTTAKIALACGMIGEIPPDTIRKLRQLCDILVGDVQGFVRVLQADRRVVFRQLETTQYAPLIPQFDFLKASSEEIRYLDFQSVRKQTRVIVTDGENGCTLYDDHEEFSVPGYEVTVKDATGAGDCFLAGFVYGLSRGFSTQRAARLANLCGSLAVQHIGVPRLSKGDFTTRGEELATGNK